MRVHDDVLRCVVFVGIEGNGSFTPIGTAWLANYTYEDYNFNFLVTANHILDMCSGDIITARLNRRDQEPFLLRIPKMDFVRDRPNDLTVAGLPAAFPEGHEHQAISLVRDERERLEKLWTPGVGDEVATVGLYSSHQGYAKNLPVVRIGNIARMPGEPIRSTYGDAEAYLVETRSILGLSGSPVFVNIPTVKMDNDVPRFLQGEGVGAYVIGTMVGYQLVRSAEDQIPVGLSEGESEPGPDVDERNTGFAVVAPTEKVVDIISGKDFAGQMNEAITAHRTRHRHQ